MAGARLWPLQFYGHVVIRSAAHVARLIDAVGFPHRLSVSQGQERIRRGAGIRVAAGGGNVVRLAKNRPAKNEPQKSEESPFHHCQLILDWLLVTFKAVMVPVF